MKRLSAVVFLACATAGWAQTPTSGPAATHDEGIDAHIRELHSELKITQAEEAQWAKVADAMRTSAKTVDDLIETRHNNASKETALENLREWTHIAKAHAEGSETVLAAFEPLYEAMPDAQKKTADEVFRRHPSSQHEQ